MPLLHPRHDLSTERTGWIIPSAGHPTYSSQPGRVQIVDAVDAGRRAQKHRFCPWRFCGNELCCRAIAVAPGALRTVVHERPGSQIAGPPALVRRRTLLGGLVWWQTDCSLLRREPSGGRTVPNFSRLTQTTADLRTTQAPAMLNLGTEPHGSAQVKLDDRGC